jgi:predicted peroxiredoxin
METMMKETLIAAATVAGLATAAQAGEKRLVTVVTSPDAQTQLMSMVLTMQAVQQGAKARVLLCGPGGDIALKDAPESATAPQPPRGMYPQGLMRQIMEAGATVEVCAIYLPGRGVGPEALIDGVGVARPPEMAGAMLDRDAIVWSF